MTCRRPLKPVKKSLTAETAEKKTLEFSACSACAAVKRRIVSHALQACERGTEAPRPTREDGVRLERPQKRQQMLPILGR